MLWTSIAVLRFQVAQVEASLRTEIVQMGATIRQDMAQMDAGIRNDMATGRVELFQVVLHLLDRSGSRDHGNRQRDVPAVSPVDLSHHPALWVSMAPDLDLDPSWSLKRWLWEAAGQES